ncbi:hypothetical protein NKDENANG_01648 [Candidatus Entotheonellaceae bacterium PAL068K]
MIGAKCLGQPQTLGETTKHHDVGGASFAVHRSGLESKTASTLNDDGLAGLETHLMQAINHLRQSTVKRCHHEVAESRRGFGGIVAGPQYSNNRHGRR